MPQGSLLSMTFKGKSIGPQSWQNDGFLTIHGKEGLRRILQTDFGMSSKMASVFVNRRTHTIKRIEEFISGLVDAFICADPLVFTIGSRDRAMIMAVVHNVLRIGATDLQYLIKSYKVWANELFHLVAQTRTIGPLSKPSGSQPFRPLNKLSFITALRHGRREHLLLQRLAHIVSTRQYPYMGIKTEEESWKKLNTVLTSDFRPDPITHNLLVRSARRIGGICRSIRPGPIPNGAAHISVTCSGERNFPVAKGAQAGAVMDALSRVLTEEPLKDETENTPFGPAVKKAGIPVWKTLFREDDDVIPEEAEFLSVSNKNHSGKYPKEVPGRFWGLDDCLGRQTLYVAWKEYNSTQIPILRAQCVPEMGNKARYVTLSEYWLNVLQAPLAHLLIESMKWHPSVFSSFHRQDQAWEAAKMISKLPLSKEEWDDSSLAVLSSDLKDATNAQQHALTRDMLKAFMVGYGYGDSPYVDLVLSTIGPRLVVHPNKFESILTTVGIMMGEAIAKPSLTLLNLAIEELSFLDYTGNMAMLDTVSSVWKRKYPWRMCHIGGDDHLLVGPTPYLDLVTDYHLKAGSHISDGQHGWSKICVKYTERILNIENFWYKKPLDGRNNDHSTIVDSVKVRLLEQGQSTLLQKDNKNVAIGKSSQIAGCLNWLPIDKLFWPRWHKVLIRTLFISRMGSFLPKKSINPKCFHAIHLPVEIGGYGLGFKEDMQRHLLESPAPFRWLLSKAKSGLDIRRDVRIFRKLNTNPTRRGISSITEYEERIVGQLNDWPNMVNAISWKELQLKYPADNDNPRSTVAKAAQDNILSVEEFAKRAVRGNLFQSLLMGEEKIGCYNTRPFAQTLSRVWSQCEELDLDIFEEAEFSMDSNEIYRLIKSINPSWYFDVSQLTSLDVGYYDPEFPEEETYDFKEATCLKKYEMGTPSLNIGKKFLGLQRV